jgi:hypothetical protein
MLRRPSKDHLPFREASMVTMDGNKTNQAGTLRMILLWASEGM